MSYTWAPPDTSSRPVAVVGGGVLGRRLCMMWSSTGKTVNLFEKSPEVAKSAAAYVQENVEVHSTKLGSSPGVLNVSDTLEEAVKDAWMVIEAIPEIVDLKIPLFGTLDVITQPDCILATNSSSYRSGDMVEKVTRKYRVCNSHYYIPPEKNALEVMTCGYTDPAIFPFLMDEAKTVGFLPIHARVESTGLIFNRVWAAIKREALHVMAEGVAKPEEIDMLFNNWFNVSQGPCGLMDKVGLDTVYNIEAHYIKEKRLDSLPIDWLKENYLDKGELGEKSGKGLLCDNSL
jgi:3-hydroxybutyryl-CoA dehydrogenase